MTAIVGIRCRDGIVLGADGSATFGGGRLRTIEQPTDYKIQIVEGRILVAGTGEVGLGQRFVRVVERMHADKGFKGNPTDVAVQIAQKTIADFGATQAEKGAYGALLAYPVEDKPHLAEFAVKDLQPELKDDHLWYCSMGNAQPITDPFLGFVRRVFWRAGPPTVAEGVFAALWTLRQAIELNPGGVGGEPVVGVLVRGRDAKLAARCLTKDELAEQQDAVEAAEEHLRAFRAANRAAEGDGFPDVPP